MRNRAIASLLVVFFICLGWLAPDSGGVVAVSFEEKYADNSMLFMLYSLDVKVNSDWSYTEKINKTVKVLKEDAKVMGEIPIYYEKGREEIVDLEAFTTTPDNKKLGSTKVQDFAVYVGYPMYSDDMVKVVTLPEVTIGSILEHKYTRRSKGMPIKNAFWYMYDISCSMPAKEFRFTITMPENLGIKYKEFGLTRKPVITRAGGDITYSWVLNDINDDEEEEEYLPPPTPEMMREGVEFSSIGSWKDISDWILSLEKKNLAITPDIMDKALKLTKGKATVRDKARSIMRYVQKDFRYVSMSFGNNGLEPHSTDEVFRNKYGDCKDLSLLCKAMLAAVGVDSNTCLFNTEYDINDPQYDLPVPTLFDHVILMVKDEKEGDFYLDPLLDGYDIGEYPLDYQMAYIFLVADDGGKFERFPIFEEKRNYTGTNNSITIAKDGSALIEGEGVWDLDFSIVERRRLKNYTNKEMEQFNATLDTYLVGGGEMIKRELRGSELEYGVMKPYNKMKRKNEYPITGGIMIIDVSGFERGSDFANKDRKYPIFYPINSVNEEVSDYNIPEGYEIIYLPPNVDIDNGFVNIKREYVKTPGGVKITEVTRHKRVELPKEEYIKLKEFYDNLTSTTQQRIIVKEVAAAG